MNGGQADGRTGGRVALAASRAFAGRAGFSLFMLLLLSACPPVRPSALSAQTDPRLVQGMRLAQEGLGDSARGVVQRVVEATDPADTLYPQALFTRAVVGANPQDMRRDLQRVAVEYSSSSWADDALLRLAQLDYATGELEGASRDLERLRLDYSSSPLYAQAAFWAARVYFDLRKPPSACRWVAEGLPRAGNDLELRNQLAFYSQRCGGVALDTATAQADGRTGGLADERTGGQAANTDSTQIAASTVGPTDTARPAAPESLSARPPVRPSAFRIQIAAVNTRGAADSIAKRVKAAGFDAVVAAEKGLFKVRVGPYASRAQAQAALPSVRAKLGGKPFLVAES